MTLVSTNWLNENLSKVKKILKVTLNIKINLPF